MADAAGFSYDQVPYEGTAFWQTHPDRLALVGRLMGLNPPDVRRARVLELGCASGENLVPMAYALREATFVGVDLSGAQIAAGQRLIDQLGLTNIRLHEANILDLGPELGTFDYLICHGVYSWVSAVVQEKILALCAQQVAPDGLAMLSYNVYPGWHAKHMVREMMRYHAGQFAQPREQVAAAREIVSFAAESNVFPDSPYGAWLAYMNRSLAGARDSYVFHEYMEEHNEPLYFHQFWERLTRHQLHYVGDTAQLDPRPADVAAKVWPALDRLAPDYVHRAQYLDFLQQRAFRYSVVSRCPVPTDRQPRVAALDGMFLLADEHLRIGSERRANDVTDDSPLTFRGRDGTGMTTRSPLAKAALDTLLTALPRVLTLDQLHAQVAQRLAVRPDAPRDPGVWRSALAAFLLQAVCSGMVHAHTVPPPCVTTVSVRPRVSALARALSASARAIPTLRHRAVEPPDPLVVEVLRRADGTRTLAELAAALTRDEPAEETQAKVAAALAWCAREGLLEG